MKPCSLARSIGSLVVLAIGFITFPATGKPIRLRHETITPAAAVPSRSANSAALAAPPATGLFLIQFAAPPSPSQREQLQASGVELLQYVPEDTFIARLSSAQPGAVRQLSFVTWLGPYRPEYKIHRGLLRTIGDDTNRSAAVLLSARASSAEVLLARRLLQSPRQSRAYPFGVILRGELKSAQLAVLARSDAVLWIEPAPKMKLLDEVASKIVAGDGGANTLYTQSLGYDGSGVKVAVADTGLDTGNAATMHLDLRGRTPAFLFYGSLTDAVDEHSHGTHCAGIIAGNGATRDMDDNGALWGLGVAPGAEIVAQRIFDGEGNFEAPSSFEQLTRDAKNAGADIGSNSWGDDTQGRYDLSAQEFDALVRDANALVPGDQPYILEFSAGNAGPGPQTMDSPAVGKNVIATGASQNDRVDLFIYDEGGDAMADFSSRGPCEDGRIKPDLVAPGTWISSAKSSQAPDDNSWSPIDDLYLYVGGTSQAGPHVAGAAAVFVQYFRSTHTNATPSPALVKAALINSAADMEDSSGTAPVPNMDEGWGRVDLTELIGSDRGYAFLDQSVLLAQSQTCTQTVLVASPAEPLRITLTYTDFPGFPGAIPALVNDLDLIVTGPDGRVYRGNQFSGGESIPDATAADSINNVEAVYLATPMAGEYTVQVFARNVVQDARQDTGAIDQDFALVVSGPLPEAGAGLMILDRGHYRAPDRISLKVIDHDQAGSANVSVLVRSTTEPAGENVVLTAANGTGTFTNSIATATGAAAGDGVLQIAHGNLIEVRYFDVSAGTNRTATAFADFQPPVLTLVAAVSAFGQTTVTWHSDEPATSIVRYGTNSVLNLAATNSALTTEHSVALSGLVANRTYQFAVSSTDEAGNSATNINGGGLFNFVAQPAATALLVDEYGDDGGFGAPPLSGYTSALNQLGVSYELWDVSSRGSPTLANLSPFRAVIWRVPELTATWSSAERVAISNYVHSGGGLFVASMEVLTRLDEANASGFWRNILHVQSYVTDAGVHQITGTTGAPVGDGIDTPLDYSEYETVWDILIQLGFLPDADISDTISPATNAVAVLTDNGAVAGLRWPKTGVEGPGRVVFLSFPFDAVPNSGSGTNARAQLLRNVIQFLVPGVNGLGTIALDSPAYTLPGLVTVEVGDTDLTGAVSATATFFSDTQTNGVAVTLNPAGEPGVFRGTVTLVAATNPPGPGILRAKNGDTIRAQYFDVSGGAPVQVFAVVDTNAPVIMNVGDDPDYVEITVSWETSEPTDSLVQFGESAFLGRTAYDPTLSTEHELTLTGLQPDKIYYYQVASRDAAGNQAVNDNAGQLFTTRTLAPLQPPVFENFDTSTTNWTVQTADGAQSEWTSGVPNNGKETSAYSPPTAFGSNLKGGPLDYSETFLISPAIDLTGATHATLKFRQSFDFTMEDFDILNGGELLIITNTTVDPVSLMALSDVESAGYELAEIDLSPFTGRVVYLVWFYQLFSFESDPRPAWIIDDVSVTVSNLAGGTIQITNSLWQAHFVMTGPTNFSGKGISSVISNAPAGQYLVNFSAVPYYQTPIQQSGTLGSGGTLSFNGSYTFADANSNGIPDSFELGIFGSVDPGRTQNTDTDHDGLSDFAEFIAGTDPNSPTPAFKITAQRLTNGNVRLDWPTAPGHSYRVLSGTNFSSWTPSSGWMPAAGTTTNYTVTPATGGPGPTWFRVEATSGSQPATFGITARRMSNNVVRLEWFSVIDRAYRVEGSTNGKAWTPVSAWIQASGTNATYTLPTYTNGAPYLFRVEVRP